MNRLCVVVVFLENCQLSEIDLSLSILFLLPAYIVRQEGNSFTLLVCPQGGVRSSRGGGQVKVQSGVRSKSNQGGSGQSQPGGGSGQSSWGGGQVSPAGGVRSVQPRGGSASCALLRAVCLLRSCRRTFLFNFKILYCTIVLPVLFMACSHWPSNFSFSIPIPIFFPRSERNGYRTQWHFHQNLNLSQSSVSPSCMLHTTHLNIGIGKKIRPSVGTGR